MKLEAVEHNKARAAESSFILLDNNKLYLFVFNYNKISVFVSSFTQ